MSNEENTANNGALEAAKAAAERTLAWMEEAMSPERTAAREAAYRAKEAAKAERVREVCRAAAVARWKGYAPRPTVQAHVYREDAELLSKIRPWDGKRWTAAAVIHRLLAASENIFWQRDEKGAVTPLGPMALPARPGERR